jgi:hypothetical protein
MNTYEKPGGRGAPASGDFLVYPDLRGAARLPRSSRGHFRRHMRLMHPEWIYAMRHVTPLSPVASLACAYFPSPRECALIRSSHQGINSVSPCRRLPRPGRGGKSHVLSSLPPLCRSLRSFSHSLPLFSTACSLFYENTRVGVPDCSTFGRGDVPTFRRSDETFRKSKSPALRRGLCHKPNQLTCRSGTPTRSVYAGCSVLRR